MDEKTFNEMFQKAAKAMKEASKEESFVDKHPVWTGILSLSGVLVVFKGIEMLVDTLRDSGVEPPLPAGMSAGLESLADLDWGDLVG